MTITSGRNLGLMLLGLLIIFVAALVAWVSSFLLYGFGELIEKTGEIARNTRGNVAVSETQARANDERIATAERLRAQGLISEEEYRQVVTRK